MEAWKDRLFLKALSVAALFLAFTAFSRADSLYPVESGTSLYGKIKGHKVGDVITVVIVESAKASQENLTQTEKDAVNSLGAGAGGFTGGFTLPVTKFGVGTNKRHKGRGSSRKSGSFQTTMTAKVIQVLPNGNMLVKGARYMELNDEMETVEVEGEVRPEDISQENMILSTSVANARIRYKGRGPLTESSRPGLVTRILDWLWIF
jgi:flagellar L-ring protein precursor FlgH